MQTPTNPDNSEPPVIDVIDDELLTDSQAGRLLGVSPASVCRYRLEGKRGIQLPWTWYGRKKVTTRACIDWWQRELQRVARSHSANKANLKKDLRERLASVAAACKKRGV